MMITSKKVPLGRSVRLHLANVWPTHWSWSLWHCKWPPWRQRLRSKASVWIRALQKHPSGLGDVPHLDSGLSLLLFHSWERGWAERRGKREAERERESKEWEKWHKERWAVGKMEVLLCKGDGGGLGEGISFPAPPLKVFLSTASVWRGTWRQ